MNPCIWIIPPPPPHLKELEYGKHIKIYYSLLETEWLKEFLYLKIIYIAILTLNPCSFFLSSCSWSLDSMLAIMVFFF